MPEEQTYVRRVGSVALNFRSSNPRDYTTDRDGHIVVPFHVRNRSPAFDHNRPGPLLVDPGLSGGGQMLDLRNVSHDQLQQAVQEGQGDVLRSVNRLVELQHQPQPAKQAAAQPIQSNGWSQPMSGLPQPAGSSVAPIPYDPEQGLPMQTAAQPIQSMAGGPPPSAGNILDGPLTVGHLMQLLPMLKEMFNPPAATPPPMQAIPDAPVYDPSPTLQLPGTRQVSIPSVHDMQAAEAKVVGRHRPEETLPVSSCPINLNAPPVRPQYEVHFQVPGYGTIRASYHHLSARNDLVLYYDTRYDGGHQFMPETNDQPIVVDIPAAKKRFTVLSKGLCDSFGPIDWCLLVVSDVTEL